jgi:hypothetical protein
MLLAALHDAGYIMTRSEATDFVRRKHWFDIQQEDWLPYPSQADTSHEPRWKTVLAYARKECADRGLMPKKPRNEWHLTRDGVNLFNATRQAGRDRSLDVPRCYLWSPQFKRYIDPTYQPSPQDVKRPVDLYNDWLPIKADAIIRELGL